MGLFSNVTDLNNASRLIELFSTSGPAVRREIALATGAQGKADWLRQHWGELPNMDSWLRRSVYFAIRRLPELERARLVPDVEDSIDGAMTRSLLATSSVAMHGLPGGRRVNLEVKPAIALVTALTLELAAMRAMLIKPTRPNVDRQGGMREYYVGKVPARNGEYHDVVLALSGVGNNIAAARATAVVHDFPSVKCILMVGIAGGCPNPDVPAEHVRLGDIVVSGERGIIQYDFVKKTVDNTELRFWPRPPSASVLEAVQFLQSEYMTAKNPLGKLIGQAMKKLRQKRPSAELDVLVVRRHPKDPSRVRNYPRVFVAPIGSANILLKDPETRNMLRDSYGVRAIEMEGSGIADATWALGLGYMVIRGICDYGDQSKSDTWQPYAAVVASAYTRALLESMAKTGF